MKILKPILNLFKGKINKENSPKPLLEKMNSAQPDNNEVRLGEVLESRILDDNVSQLMKEQSEYNNDLNLSKGEPLDISNSQIENEPTLGQLSNNEWNEENSLIETSNEITIGEPEDIPEKEYITPSLLENRTFVKLVEECVDIMNEFDSYTDRMETDEGKIMTSLIVQRLQESLERSGLSRIDDEDFFSILRHIPIPISPVAENELLADTIKPGLSIDNRIFRKAKVVLKPQCE